MDESMRVGRTLSAILICAALGGCSDDEVVEPAGFHPGAVFGAEVDTLVVEVDYAQGAAPYVGKLGGFGELWGVAAHNLEVLLPDDTLIVPTSLEQMEAIGPLVEPAFSRDTVLALAANHRDELPTDTRASIYVLWLDGFYEEDGLVDEDVLGIHFGGEAVIAMFKPALADLGASPGPHVEKYVEQATLVHELGHALGLVNRGLPLTSDHHDAENGHHCSNPDCVMFHQVEGSAGAKQFSKDLKSSGATLWGQECIDDARAALAP